MAKQHINTGTTPSDRTGDSVRTAFDKTNANFTELFDAKTDIAEALSEETAARQAADTANAAAIASEASARATAISSEATARSAADATNASAIATEATTRAAADAANASAIATETAARIAADALKADLVGGVIPTAQIPAIAISTYLGSAANQAAMLALGGQSGDWCNRSDTSTAWVITGADPTQLSSWAQINYPASPVTSVNGQTGVIVLGKGDVGLDQASNTSDANKPVSTAQQAALDLKQNRSTLASDVATAVHALASKPTPVDADEVPFVDSAASFGPKKLTWANLKLALATYLAGTFASLSHASRHRSGGADAIKLDELAAPTTGTALDATITTHGLMSSADKTKLNGIAAGANNYTLPAPTESTLGGVKRNPGTGGQYVKGIATDGALIFDTPAGGGGSSIVVGQGTLQGYTDLGGGGNPAGHGNSSLYFQGWTPEDFGTFTISNENGSVTFTVAEGNPEDGTEWLQPTRLDLTDGASLKAWVMTVLTESYALIQIVGDGAENIDFQSPSTGSASFVSTASTTNGIGATGQANGVDAYAGTPPSGEVTSVAIINPTAGKKLLPLRIGGYTDGFPGMTIGFFLLNLSTNEQRAVCEPVLIGEGPFAFEIGNPASGGAPGGGNIGTQYAAWSAVESESWALHAYYSDPPPTEGSIILWAQAWQYD